MPRKTSAPKTCPITRAEFGLAPPLKIDISDPGDNSKPFRIIAGPREFATGSLGWWNSDKIDLLIAGRLCRIQVNMNITVIGSKELPKEKE